MRKFLVIFFAVFALLPSSRMYAEPPGDLGPLQVSGANISQDSGNSISPAAAIDGNGILHVVWQDDTSGNNEILYRHWDGSTWSAVENLSQTSGVSQAPAIATDSTGNVHVVWQDNTPSFYAHYDILYRRWSNGVWSPTEKVSQSSGNSEQAAVAVANGLVHVVWQDNASGNFEIMHRTWNGSVWSVTENLSQNTGASVASSVAADASGNVYVAWQDNTSGNNEVLLRRWSASGWSPTENVSQNVGDSSSPCVVAGPSGAIYLTWQDSSPGNPDILFRSWNGTGWSVSENISHDVGESALPKLAADSSGKLDLAWQDNTSGSQGILLRRSDGSSWSLAELVSDSPTAKAPAVAVDANGKVYVVWQDYAPGNNEILYASPTLPSINQLHLAAGWNLISVPTPQQDPAIGSVFALAPSVTKVYSPQNNSWLTASRNGDFWVGTLTQIVDGKGYWVFSAQEVVLGLKPNENTSFSGNTYPVYSGWNMIGFTTALSTTPVDTYLSSVQGKWTSLYHFDPAKGWEIARPGGIGFSTMEQGSGYWLFLTSGGVLAP